jgi:twinkle protein
MYKQTHLPCDECGSSDALCINEDDSTYCHSCGSYKRPSEETKIEMKINKPLHSTDDTFLDGRYSDIPARHITHDTCRRMRYRIGEYKGRCCHIADYYDDDRKLVGQKLRFEGKQFMILGKIADRFYGQHLHPMGGMKLVVTEGEVDALSVSQIQDNKYAVVSLPTGSQSAANVFKKNLRWLEKWQEVILMFDEDEPGRKAVEDVVGILPAGKAKVARLPLKDANECLVNKRSKDVIHAIFQANPWRPDAIISGADIHERLVNPKHTESIPYPFDGLNRMTRGIRKGEIVTFCAGSGQGKSQICRIICHHILTTTDKSVGYIALEESIERTALGIVGLEMGKQLHLDPESIYEDLEFDEAYTNTVGSGRMWLYDHWGSLDPDRLLSHIMHMAKALDVEYVVLDHISLCISGLQDGDERRIIDNMMTKLRSLVEECGIALILVSHLKRPSDGRGHEEGTSTSLAHLRGSAAIAQLSDMVVGLERNQQDTEHKHLTAIRVLKNRFSGETGLCDNLSFNPNTGRMAECNFEAL